MQHVLSELLLRQIHVAPMHRRVEAVLSSFSFHERCHDVLCCRTVEEGYRELQICHKVKQQVGNKGYEVEIQ